MRRLQPTLRALMECAKNGLYYPARSKRTASIRLMFLRSNLSRHHVVMYLRNRPACLRLGVLLR